jgi:hypothetical protein
MMSWVYAAATFTLVAIVYYAVVGVKRAVEWLGKR